MLSFMERPTIAIVVKSPHLRLAVAKVFDGAPQSWRVHFCEGPSADADVVIAEPGYPGDGIVFDGDRPGNLIPEVMARLERSPHRQPCRAVAVTGVPGAGVTSIALHLASVWARQSATCFVDLDQSWSCAARLGLGEGVVTWGGAGTSPEELKLSSVPVAPGLRALIAPPGETDMDDVTLIRRARSAFDRVVFDLPFAGWKTGAASGFDAVLLVMSPCLPHAHRVAGMLREIEGERVAVITNRLGRGGETVRDEIEAVIGRRVTVEMPTFPGLRDAEGTGRLASLSWSRWGRSLIRLARALEAS
jgi:hypothetical protein